MNVPLTIIEARRGWTPSDLAELGRFRDLWLFLAWRDVRVRYRQTALGAAWALLEPLVGVAIFTVVFHRVAGFSAGPWPYALFCYAALVIWSFFARALRETSQSLVVNATLLRKVYFPRLVLPLAALATAVVDFALALVMYFAMQWWYGVPPTWALLTVPFWLLLAVVNVLGVGLALAALNVRWRDVTQALPFVVQTWMFLTPVVYPLQTQGWGRLFWLNPLTGVVEGMRWALLPGYALDPTLLVSSIGLGGVTLALGLILFGRAERGFADII
jgi:lipopolysaccharide transport system permease protein